MERLSVLFPLEWEVMLLLGYTSHKVKINRHRLKVSFPVLSGGLVHLAGSVSSVTQSLLMVRSMLASEDYPAFTASEI